MSREIKHPEPADLTQLIRRWSDGDERAKEELFSVIERQLRRIAARRLRTPAAHHRFQATEVVNEAFIKLAGQHPQAWNNRRQFFAIVARIMDRAIVDGIRYQGAQSRDVDMEIALDAAAADRPEAGLTGKLVALDSALDDLSATTPDAYDVFIKRAFGGRSLHEIAASAGRSEDWASRKWKFARAFVTARVSDGGSSRGGT